MICRNSLTWPKRLFGRDGCSIERVVSKAPLGIVVLWLRNRKSSFRVKVEYF